MEVSSRHAKSCHFLDKTGQYGSTNTRFAYGESQLSIRRLPPAASGILLSSDETSEYLYEVNGRLIVANEKHTHAPDGPVSM